MKMNTVLQLAVTVIVMLAAVTATAQLPPWTITYIEDSVFFDADTVLFSIADTSRGIDSIPFSVKIANAFSQLDTADVPAPFLIDRAGLSRHVLQFDGRKSNDTTFPNIMDWLVVHGSLEQGTMRWHPPMTPVDTMLGRIAQALDDGETPLLFMHIAAAIVSDSAIVDSLLEFSSDSLSYRDVPGRSTSPYQEHPIAMLSSGFTAPRSLVQSYRIDKARFFVTNQSDSLYLFRFDAGDGLGWRQISADTLLTVSYVSEGTKVLKLSWLQSGSPSDTLVVQTTIVIDTTEESMPMGVAGFAVLNKSDQPDELLTVYATRGYAGGVADADVAIWYGCGNGEELVRPIIVVEGIDILDIRDHVRNYRLLNKGEQALGGRLLEVLRSKGYDIVLFNPRKSADYIQRNAFALQELIAEVNNRKVGKHDNIVLGISMGGVIARYALADMEKNGVPHNTRIFASFDSPHRGAYVPPSAQFVMWQGEEMLDNLRHTMMLLPLALGWAAPLGWMTMQITLDAVERNIRIAGHSLRDLRPSNLLDARPAIRQLLLFSVPQDWRGTIAQHVLRTDLVRELNSPTLGMGWPNAAKDRAKTRNVAIVNGSIAGAAQSNSGGPGSGLQLMAEYRTLPSLGVHMEGKLSTTADGGWGTIAKLYSTWLWLPSWSTIRMRTDHCWECLPGGANRDAHSTKTFSALLQINFPFQQFAYIPTVSSIAVDQKNWKANVLEQFQANGGLPSPMDAFYGEVVGNTEHTLIVDSVWASFVQQEVMTDVLYLQNMTINRDVEYSAASEIHVGTDVYPANFNFRPADGDVVLGPNARLRLSAPRVVLEPGFESRYQDRLHVSSRTMEICTYTSGPLLSRVSRMATVQPTMARKRDVRTLPNPAVSWVRTEIGNVVGKARVEVVDMQGRVVAILHDGTEDLGTDLQVDWNASVLPSGNYLVVVTDSGGRRSMMVTKVD